MNARLIDAIRMIRTPDQIRQKNTPELAERVNSMSPAGLNPNVAQTSKTPVMNESLMKMMKSEMNPSPYNQPTPSVAGPDPTGEENPSLRQHLNSLREYQQKDKPLMERRSFV